MSKTLNKTSMTELIFTHLLTKGSITNVEAQALYRCRALPRRIADLKEDGVPIISVLKKDATGQRYARYELNTEAL
jgi:hypothetical protein